MFGKLAVFFFGLVTVMLLLVAASAIMLKDTPTDTSIYVNDTSINKTTQLTARLVSTTPGMLQPAALIGGIILLGGGLMVAFMRYNWK
jgi:hypothetical protein